MTASLAPRAKAVAHRQCQYCTARAHSPCGGLRDPQSLESLDAAHNLPRRVASGDAIIAEGDATSSTYTILNGWIAVVDTLANGATVILHFALPGDVVPLELHGERSTRSAIAVGDAIVCSFGRVRHQRLLREDALYSERYQAAIARELHFAYDHFVDVVLSSAAERVLKLLWELAVRSLRRRPTATERIPAPLTQIQIGLATGLTAVHVSRTLRQLREQGLIELSGHAITILDPVAVESLAGVSEDTMAMWA